MILVVSNTQQPIYQLIIIITPLKKGGQNIEVSFIQSFWKKVFFHLLSIILSLKSKSSYTEKT